ncbi:MAG TPA: flagellar biosynthesis protein FlhB [Beijerinckiaceae bacterium]|jgi:flagellar biosynthetic protein FlhB
MADGSDQEDRTEEPTQKRLEDAIKRGDVAKSVELNTLFVLGGFALAIVIASGPASRGLALDLRGFLMNAHLVPSDGAGLMAAGRVALLAGLSALALPLLCLFLAALAGGSVQHRPLWTFEPLVPKFNRISPMAGAKRIFGTEAWIQFVKSLLKLAIVGAVAAGVLWADRDRLEAFARFDPAAILPGVFALSLKLVGGVLAIYAFVAVGDAVYQRFSWMKRQRMTKHEIKQEYKESDGNPEIKAKLRQLRASKLKRRMMAAVPTATVIVTNPTHYAVALRYESGMPAPVCVAKGVDALALRIRTVAGEHDVPIVENPPLARALHATVEVDAEIPVEHYKAVAEVIGYVLRLRRRAS